MFHRGLLTLFLLCAAVFLIVAVGCAPVQTKSTGGQAETVSASEGTKK
jgi:hypothetical protein